MLVFKTKVVYHHRLHITITLRKFLAPRPRDHRQWSAMD